MRLHLDLTPNLKQVPFNNIPTLVGTLHKWLGKNQWHGKIALHSFSWLGGSRRANGGLNFPQGATWFISSVDEEFIKRLVNGIQQDPAVNFGLSVCRITIQEDPIFTDTHSFRVASPILIKRREGERVRHYIFSDEQADQLLTETLTTKLRTAGIDYEGVNVFFNKDYTAAKTKLVNYDGINNRASLCPVTIKGTPEQLAFAWNVGIGNSTGVGFGALI